MSHSLKLLWSGISGRSSTRSSSLLVVRQPVERLIKGGEGGLGLAQFIKVGIDRLVQVRILIVLIVFQIRVDLPDLGMDPVEFFGVGVV